MTTIYLKDNSEKNIKIQNKELEKLNIPLRFHGEDELLKEYEYFLENKEKYERFLPVENVKSYDDFKEYWNHEKLGEFVCPVKGSINFDPYFGRSDDFIEEVSKYILNNISIFEKGKGSYDTFVERCELSDSEKNILLTLYKEDVIEKLPEEEQYVPDLQNGLLLCKSFGIKPFWVVFANVKKPCFLKENVYKNKIYNGIYKDKKGLTYMSLPLMTIGDEDFPINVYNSAYNLGLREDFFYFLGMIYHLRSTSFEKMVKSFENSYTIEELKERFDFVFNNIKKEYNVYDGFVFKKNKDRFESCAGKSSTMMLESKLDILNAIYILLKKKNKVDIDSYIKKI